MNKNRLLWMLVAADVLLAFGSVGAEGLLGWTLPPALAEYAHGRASMSGVVHAFQLLLLTANVGAALAAWIGLVNFWRFARELYLLSLGLWLMDTLLSGPSVTTSVGALFKAMDGVVAGAIIGLVYFSDLSRRFEGRSANAAPAGMGLGADRT